MLIEVRVHAPPEAATVHFSLTRHLALIGPIPCRLRSGCTSCGTRASSASPSRCGRRRSMQMQLSSAAEQCNDCTCCWAHNSVTLPPLLAPPPAVLLLSAPAWPHTRVLTATCCAVRGIPSAGGSSSAAHCRRGHATRGACRSHRCAAAHHVSAWGWLWLPAVGLYAQGLVVVIFNQCFHCVHSLISHSFNVCIAGRWRRLRRPRGASGTWRR